MNAASTKLSTLLVLAVMLSACKVSPQSAPPSDLEAPSYAELARSHNQRIAQLTRVQARGVIEIAWTDESGVRRFRQGDVDLYLHLPRRTALRVSKLGNVYMWLGSDADRYWLFDLVDEPTLYTGRHAGSDRDTLQTVKPLVLLDLIGMGAMQEFDEANDTAPPQVTYNSATDTWVAESPGEGGPMRIFFDRTTLLPKHVETLSANGEVAYYSDIYMSRYRSVPVPNVSAAALPRMATLVDIFSAGPNAEAQGEVKLGLDTPTGRIDERAFERVFDFSRLRRSMRPERIEGELPAD